MTKLSSVSNPNKPNYLQLIKFLMQPLIETPDALKVDCEQFNNDRRIWLRVAFDGADKGKVFGRGGRNIQAIRTVLNSAATAAGQSLYLDIYGANDRSSDRDGDYGDRHKEKSHRNFKEHRPAAAKPSLKSRSQSY
jgi:hypothetical protein